MPPTSSIGTFTERRSGSPLDASDRTLIVEVSDELFEVSNSDTRPIAIATNPPSQLNRSIQVQVFSARLGCEKYDDTSALMVNAPANSSAATINDQTAHRQAALRLFRIDFYPIV